MLEFRYRLNSDTIQSKDTTKPNKSFLLAQEFMKSRDFASAVPELQRAVDASPSDVSLNLALSLNLYCLGNISESKVSFDRTIALDEQNEDTTDFENVLKFKTKLFSLPHNYAPDFIQGSHAPERQVFMSAVLDSLKNRGNLIEIIEIGSYAGASLLTWANAAHKLLKEYCNFTCIDPWGAKEADQYYKKTTMSLKSNQIYEIFCHNANLCKTAAKITPIRGVSKDILPKLKSNKYNLIYIDGSHYYQDVLGDIIESERLLKLGGIVCGDDLELQLDQCDPAFIRTNKKTDFIIDPRSRKHFHPGVTLAVGEYFGEVSSFSGFWAMRKTASGFEKITLREARGLLPQHWPSEYQNKIINYFSQSNELGDLLQYK